MKKPKEVFGFKKTTLEELQFLVGMQLEGHPMGACICGRELIAIQISEDDFDLMHEDPLCDLYIQKESTREFWELVKQSRRPQ